MTEQDVRLWIRPEVLELAILSVLPADKISVELGLGLDCCEVLFYTCRLFSQRTLDPQEDALHCDSQVWTLELLTLLYLHRVTSAHPRIIAHQASLHSLTNDPWPNGSCGSLSETLPLPINGSAVKKKLPEEYHLKFMKDSLSELLSLLAGHLQLEEAQTKAQKRRSGDWRSVRDLLGLMHGAGVITVEVVRALSFIIGVTVAGKKGLVRVRVAPRFGAAKHCTVLSYAKFYVLIRQVKIVLNDSTLLEVATDKTFSYQSGYLSKKNTFQKGLFEQWLLTKLDWAPHGEWLCARRGVRLPENEWACLSSSNHYRLLASPVLQYSQDAPSAQTDSPVHAAQLSITCGDERVQAPQCGRGKRLVCVCDFLEGIVVHIDGDYSCVTSNKHAVSRRYSHESADRASTVEAQDSQQGTHCLRRTASDPYTELLSTTDVSNVTTVVSPLRRSLSSCRTTTDSNSSQQSTVSLLDVKIRRCSKSQVYILQPLRHVLLKKLYDCKVVLGPVSGRLRVSECRNLTLVGPARSIVVTDSRSVTVFTLTPQRPLLISGNTSAGLSSVCFAPLNMHYPRLLHHLLLTGLNTHCNLWNRPLKLDHAGASEQLNSSAVLPPEEFQLLALPFFPATLDGRPPLLPPGLPQQYKQSIAMSQQVLCSLRAEIRDAALSVEQQAMLQRAIDQRFKAWLRENNKQRELDQLRKLSSLLSRERVKTAANKAIVVTVAASSVV